MEYHLQDYPVNLTKEVFLSHGATAEKKWRMTDQGKRSIVGEKSEELHLQMILSADIFSLSHWLWGRTVFTSENTQEQNKPNR